MCRRRRATGIGGIRAHQGSATAARTDRAGATDTRAAKGAEIAGIDLPVDEARHVEVGAFYQLGFDIATGLFGDPILGAAGKAKMDASSESIRDPLSAPG